MLMLIVVCRRYLEQNEATQAIHISMNILNTQFLLKKKYQNSMLIIIYFYKFSAVHILYFHPE